LDESNKLLGKGGAEQRTLHRTRLQNKPLDFGQSAPFFAALASPLAHFAVKGF
jgi:hypothetical protein